MNPPNDSFKPETGIPSTLPPLAKWALVCGAIGVAAILLLWKGGASDAFVYSKLVHEVVGKPQAFRNRELRVEGQLKSGSILFREDPCEWRFVLEKHGREMPVRFAQCIVPDTFRDGMGIAVTVQGKLQANGSFEANQVIPRCPSKYEMRERQKRGEEMPHQPISVLPPSAS